MVISLRYPSFLRRRRRFIGRRHPALIIHYAPYHHEQYSSGAASGYDSWYAGERVPGEEAEESEEYHWLVVFLRLVFIVCRAHILLFSSRCFAEKASQELKQKEVRRNKIVEVLGKQRRKQHTLGEVKKVVKAQRKLQKAPRRKQVAEISK